jgi:NDP-sugar pyrophosphorylase family protein
VEVAGEPFLAHQLRLVRRQGFRKVVIAIGHLGEQIEAFAGDGSRFGLDISYARDGKTKRGTGGALRGAIGNVGEEVFVTYGDSYLDIEVWPVWEAYKSSGVPALMTVLHNRDQWDPSNVVFDGKMVRVHDKTARGLNGLEWIDFGFSVFRTEIIAAWPEADPFDLSTVTRTLAQQGRLAGFEVNRRFYEIGKPDGLAETEVYIVRSSQ